MRDRAAARFWLDLRTGLPVGGDGQCRGIVPRVRLALPLGGQWLALGSVLAVIALVSLGVLWLGAARCSGRALTACDRAQGFFAANLCIGAIVGALPAPFL